jgi:hypothetical protein
MADAPIRVVPVIHRVGRKGGQRDGRAITATRVQAAAKMKANKCREDMQ